MSNPNPSPAPDLAAIEGRLEIMNFEWGGPGEGHHVEECEVLYSAEVPLRMCGAGGGMEAVGTVRVIRREACQGGVMICGNGWWDRYHKEDVRVKQRHRGWHMNEGERECVALLLEERTALLDRVRELEAGINEIAAWAKDHHPETPAHEIAHGLMVDVPDRLELLANPNRDVPGDPVEPSTDMPF